MSQEKKPASVLIYPRIKADYSHPIYASDEGKPFIGRRPDGHVELPHDQQPIIKKLYDDLVLTFAVDRGDNYEIMQNALLESNPHLSEEVLFQASVSTLTQEIGDKIELQGNPEYVVMVTAGGNLEAAIILMDSFWEQVHPLFNGDLVIAVPARDLLFITSAGNTEAIVYLKDLVKGYFENPESQGLLSKGLFLKNEGDPTLKLVEQAF